ncbi:MAG: hypothetical protein ACLFU8_13785 [Anaerolineales bacterium]
MSAPWKPKALGGLSQTSQSWSAGLFLLSAATLLFEIDLTRIFSVAQFYHFAFMIVSLAMLGFGASGTVLALFPRLGRQNPRRSLVLLALALGLTALGAYVFTNVVPFDSFSIAWDSVQVAVLALHYLALALPFFCSGAALSLLFALQPGAVPRLYATNLAGSAVGCLLALLVPNLVGGEGAVVVAALLAGVAALAFGAGGYEGERGRHGSARRRALLPAALIVLALALLVVQPPWLRLHLSPYKALSYALQYPGAEVVFREWNSFSRVDLVTSEGIRSLPGLSYRYLQPPPPQAGLFVDGDDPSPVLRLPLTALERPGERLGFTGYLPSAVAYRLRPGGEALLLEPGGGLALWTALNEGAGRVTAVEPNPLVVEAAGEIYTHPAVQTVLEEPRSFVSGGDRRYDLVALPLTAAYRPVRSGAYSLGEDYRYTREAFRDYLAALEPDGLLVVTRWLQLPPSESLRAFALAVDAVEGAGGEPARQIVALRGYATLTLLVRGSPFLPEELEAVRTFASDRAFDLVYAPDIRPEETNRYNRLEAPVYYRTFTALLEAEDREAWYAGYPFAVAPPTDNHPFFGHFFKWSQAGQVVAELGKTWQPFGGAGYFVLLVLLALALVAALAVILLPVVVSRGRRLWRQGALSDLAGVAAYFGLLGLAFLLVELPLMQRFILFLGHPSYALTAVLFAILLFSGVGSALSHHFPLRWVLALLVVLALVYPLALQPLFSLTLGLPLRGRLLIAVLALAPLGLFMGMPFPLGLGRLRHHAPFYVPWAWGVNGAASVIASVLSALLSLSFGFRAVLVVGAVCYAGALLLAQGPMSGPGVAD